MATQHGGRPAAAAAAAAATRRASGWFPTVPPPGKTRPRIYVCVDVMCTAAPVPAVVGATDTKQKQAALLMSNYRLGRLS